MEPQYGGFWIRLGAFLLDAVILVPLILLQAWLTGVSRQIFCYTSALFLLLWTFYEVYCVKKWEGTPGKLICGLRIMTTSLGPVGWSEAWLRYSVNLVFGILSAIASIYAVGQMTDGEFSSLGYMERNRRIAELEGAAGTAIIWLNQVWAWSEFIVLLANKRRRALHDFIAGTVVIRRGRSTAAVQ